MHSPILRHLLIFACTTNFLFYSIQCLQLVFFSLINISISIHIYEIKLIFYFYFFFHDILKFYSFVFSLFEITNIKLLTIQNIIFRFYVNLNYKNDIQYTVNDQHISIVNFASFLDLYLL